MSRATKALAGEIGFGPDIGPADAAHLVFVRSPVAHAAILDIDTTDAAAMPGVLGVFTAVDVDLPHYTQIPGLPEGQLQPPLAIGEVRFVGQRVAAVVARTLAQAVDAVETVVVDYDPRDPVLDPMSAATVAGPWEVGEPWIARPDDVAVTVGLHNPRVAPSPIETTTGVAEPDGAGGLVVRAGSQLPSSTHAELCAALGLDEAQLRFVSVCRPLRGGPVGTHLGQPRPRPAPTMDADGRTRRTAPPHRPRCRRRRRRLRDDRRHGTGDHAG